MASTGGVAAVAGVAAAEAAGATAGAAEAVFKMSDKSTAVPVLGSMIWSALRGGLATGTTGRVLAVGLVVLVLLLLLVVLEVVVAVEGEPVVDDEEGE